MLSHNMHVHMSVYIHTILFIAVSNEVIYVWNLDKIITLLLVSERERKLDSTCSTWVYIY